MCDLIQSSEIVRRDADAVIPTPTRAGGRTGDFHGDENASKMTTPPSRRYASVIFTVLSTTIFV